MDISQPPINDQARLSALYEVSRMLGTSLNLDEVLCMVIDSAIHLTDAERGFLMLTGDTGDELIFRLARNASKENLDESLFEISRTVVHEVARTGVPVVTINAQDDPRFAGQGSVLQFGLRSILATPLIVRGKTTGVLYVDNKVKTAVFTENELALLNTFSGQAAVAIENARLFEALQRHNIELEKRVEERAIQISAVNQELETFSYSVAHDLRAPLRAINGYSQILLEDYQKQLDTSGRSILDNILLSAKRMQRLIDDLLTLSRLARAEMERETVDLSTMAHTIAKEFTQNEPERKVNWSIAPGIQVQGDPQLLRTVMENLLGNAWKFTGKQPLALIEFGKKESLTETVYWIRDNGAGFNQNYAQRLFGPFQRLHTDAEFPGIGIGLASVKRIIQRHGGRIWAESTIDDGATFFFTLR